MRRADGARSTVLAGMLLAWSPCGFGLNPALDVSQYAHTAWKVREGFSKGAVTSIAQTSDGYLWLGTEFGLLRFDGVRTLPWQAPPGQRLPNSFIASLLAARDGTLWIGTLDGLASWKGGKLSLYPELSGLTISALLEDREGSLWIGASGPSARLCIVKSGSVQCYLEGGAIGRSARGLHEDSKGNIWLAVSNGVWRWKPGPPRFYPLPAVPDGYRDLIEADDGTLLTASYGGIRRVADGRAEPHALLDALGQFHASRLLRDRDGGLWIGTDRGLLHVHQGRTDVFAKSDGLSGDSIYRLYEDREGNVWVATANGLDRFRDLAVTTFSDIQGLSKVPVVSVVGDPDGSVWMGTYDGLNRWNNGQATVYWRRGVRRLASPTTRQRIAEIDDGGLPDNSMQSLYQDDNGRLWVSTRLGVAYFEDGRFVPLSSVPSTLVHSFAEESSRDFWIGDQERGLLHLIGGRLVEQISWATLGANGFATVLVPDRAHGGLWLGFPRGGVAYFKDGRIRVSYAAPDGLGEGRVSYLRLDPDGTLWAATGGGFSRVKDGRIATLTSRNGLPCDAVHWVMEDDAHSFWLNTACGLVRVARSELDAWAAAVNKPVWKIKATVFDSSDGVRSLSIPGGYTPQVTKSRDGRLWFSTSDGVSVVDPRHLPFNKLPPPVHVETVKVNGKEVAKADGIALSHSANDIEIDYTALSLTIPERVRFRYKLEGKDADWQDVGTRRQAYYSGLAPKKYRFRVVASNNDGVWNEAGAAWSFSIVPAYYQTTWFQGLCVAGGAGLVWLLYQLRLRQMTAKVNLLYTERLAERTRIARDLHDTLLQSLAGVSLQLDGISKQAVTNPERTASLITRVREQVDFAFREARVKVWNLRSTSLEAQGLEGALNQVVERLGPAMNARCSVSATGSPRPCPPEVEEELLRIAQEAANNANRHAQASEIRIALEYDAKSLTLSVADDGRGFDFEEGLGKSGHWGLKNMQERAAQIRGTCKIKTAVGQGTQVEVRVPLSSSWSVRNTLAKHANPGSRS